MQTAGSSDGWPHICAIAMRGFSAIELMVTLAVAGILLGIGIPAFAALIANQKMASAVNDFAAAINLTRAEAIRRGGQVTLVPADGRDWKSGWMVFVDGNDNLHHDPDEPLVFTHDPLPEHLTIESDFTDSSAKYLAYNGNGRTRTANSSHQPQSGTVTFTLGKQARKIKVNFLGRARMCNPADEPATC